MHSWCYTAWILSCSFIHLLLYQSCILVLHMGFLWPLLTGKKTTRETHSCMWSTSLVWNCFRILSLPLRYFKKLICNQYLHCYVRQNQYVVTGQRGWVLVVLCNGLDRFPIYLICNWLSNKIRRHFLFSKSKIKKLC